MPNMRGASFLPARLRGLDTSTEPRKHGWLSRQLTPVLLSLSHRACAHPIYTLVSVAILASTTYLGLIESSLFDRRISVNNAIGRMDFNNLLAGSKRLYAGPETTWKWSVDDARTYNSAEDNLALVTLVFPDSISRASRTAPHPHSIPIPTNYSAKILPCSSNRLSPISYDSTLAFSVPFAEAPKFLSTFQEISVSGDASQTRYSEDTGSSEEKMWIMKAVRSPGSEGIGGWVSEVWSEFLDLLKNAESLDILIMALGYIAMHLTFVSLFLSMRRLGSNFWLAASVLLSSIFAFLFGLIVTTRLGVPLNMVLLSEGLPFLVVTIGFEKPIMLTRAVLAASLDKKSHSPTNTSARDSLGSLPTTQEAVRAAVKEDGAAIVRDYFIEILILVAGAASGVQGGLRQFCFLAAWILFFDCVLLFTFYTAILTVKLEINRIKRHVALRKALEDDLVPRRVAENVAASNDWPRLDANGSTNAGSLSKENPVFGKKVGDTAVPRFKILMVGGFLFLNVVNLCMIPFRNNSGSDFSWLSSIVTQPPMDPFKVAGNGLDTVLSSARQHGRSTIVTVLAPIKYELEYPSVHYAPRSSLRSPTKDFPNPMFDGMGGRVVEGVLKSFEDPVLSKWIVVALALSLVLNGYLFNAARWTIKEPMQLDQPPQENEVMAGPVPVVPGQVHQQPEEPEEDELDRENDEKKENAVPRTLDECVELYKAKKADVLTDDELVQLTLRGKIPGHSLEKALPEDILRAVKIRRSAVSRTHATRDTSRFLEHSKLPYKHFDYERVSGACCENVIGYMPLPLGVAGPLMIDGKNYFLPMATTEGVLVASTSRGCKAINSAGGAITVLTGDGMTRGPCVCFESVQRAASAKVWLDSEEGQQTMRDAFNSTSAYARLQTLKTALAGTYLYIRFKTTTGDAMGMNMISKGCEQALRIMKESGFEDMLIISLSGNYCTDKKPSAINWIDGRGKSVVAGAVIAAADVQKILKSDVDSLVKLNLGKNLVGSAMAGSIGGFNAHAANIVAAMFIATGQDPAQVVESCNCITLMEKTKNGDLHISVTMPSIEVGSIGGGTILEPQSSMLDLLGVRGPHPQNPGDNARQLARIIAAAVLAGELSLCSALAAGHLVQAHMAHNRSAQPSRSTTPAPPASGLLSPTTMAMTTRGR